MNFVLPRGGGHKSHKFCWCHFWTDILKMLGFLDPLPLFKVLNPSNLPTGCPILAYPRPLNAYVICTSPLSLLSCYSEGTTKKKRVSLGVSFVSWLAQKVSGNRLCLITSYFETSLRWLISLWNFGLDLTLVGQNRWHSIEQNILVIMEINIILVRQ